MEAHRILETVSNWLDHTISQSKPYPRRGVHPRADQEGIFALVIHKQYFTIILYIYQAHQA